jgi:hypothetical protein
VVLHVNTDQFPQGTKRLIHDHFPDRGPDRNEQHRVKMVPFPSGRFWHRGVLPDGITADDIQWALQGWPGLQSLPGIR